MKKWFLVFAWLFLAGCGGPRASEIPAILISTPSGSIPLQSPTPIASNVILSTAISSPSSTLASTEIPTHIYTLTATDTPISFNHVFPIQPPGAAGFAEGTSSHGYPATDIFAPAGTKFVAVTDGVVDFVSTKDLWDRDHDDPALRGGLSVAIIGDDGVRYYGSHLSTIAEGIIPRVRVTAGEELGLVGNSGDARTTESHLHFGISRPSYTEDWKARRGEVDPYPFLIAWRDGHNITPPLPDIPNDTLTETPDLHIYVFPIQPQEKAGFSEGGHPYPATDIFAPLGTRFVAVTNGTVDEVSFVDQWKPGSTDASIEGGLSVRILGDDGLRYYGAHLSAIANGIHAGVWVYAGQLLGLVGNSGDARFTNPHVHFEISISEPPFTKLDPFPLLTAWLHSQNMTPALPTP